MPTRTRPEGTRCMDLSCWLKKVGNVVLNAPPVSVAEVGAVAPVGPNEALLPPPPDCCNCAITGVNVSVLMSSAISPTARANPAGRDRRYQRGNGFPVMGGFAS